MKKCPYCAGGIEDEAIKCMYCGRFLDKKQPKKWYFKTSVVIIAFLCAGPLALPLVWFNPHFNQKKKIIITVIVLILSYWLTVEVIKSLQSISVYYKQIF